MSNDMLEVPKKTIFDYIKEIKELSENIKYYLKILAEKLYEVKVNRLYKQMGADVTWGEFLEHVGISPAYAYKLIKIVEHNLDKYLENVDVEKLYLIATSPIEYEKKEEMASEANLVTRNDLKQNILDMVRKDVCYHENVEVFIRIKCMNCGFSTNAVVRKPELIRAIRDIIRLEMEG